MEQRYLEGRRRFRVGGVDVVLKFWYTIYGIPNIKKVYMDQYRILDEYKAIYTIFRLFLMLNYL